MANIIVEVCAGTHCVMMGSMNIIDAVHSLDEIRKEAAQCCEVEVKPVPCMNLCKDGAHGPFVLVDGTLIEGGESDSVMAAIMARCDDCLKMNKQA